MKNTRKAGIIIAISVMFLFCDLVGAQTGLTATYYVATNGSDSNPGTSAQPFRTIARSTSALNRGDTLIIRSGVYAEKIVDGIPSGLSANQPTTIKAEKQGEAILRPSASGGNVIQFSSGKDRSYIVLDGLVLDVGNLGGEASGLRTSSSAIITGLVIRNSIIKDARAGDCIVFGNNTTGSVVLNNQIYNCLGQEPNPGSHGMYIRGKANLIEGNHIYNTSGYCVQFYSSAGGVDDNIVRYNKLHDCQLGGVVISGATRNKAYGNVIYRTNNGIRVSSSGNTVLNNTIYNNSLSGISLGSITNTIIQNNIIYKNYRVISGGGAGNLISHNLTEDPQFTNPAAYDLRLKSTSPAIDNGAYLDDVKRDLDGVIRPQGKAIDIGAYEYVSVKATVPATPSNLQVLPK